MSSGESADVKATGALAAQTGQQPLRGVLFALLAFFLFASNDAITKSLTARLPVVQIIAMQIAFAAVPLLLLLHRQGGWLALRPKRPGLVAMRGLLAGIGSLCGTFAFSQLALAEVYAIAFCVPLLVTILSVPVLGERVGVHRWSAVLMGFLGVLVMVRPGVVPLAAGHAAAVGAACCGAGVTLILRRIAGEEHGPALVLAVVLGLLVVSAPATLFVARAPTLAEVGLLAVSGLLIGSAQFVMLEAFRRATAATVAPMQYTMMVWALLYGAVLFGDGAEPTVLTGATIVIASSLYIMHRERRRGLRPD